MIETDDLAVWLTKIWDQDEAVARRDAKAWFAGRLFDYLGGCHWESVDAFLDIANEIGQIMKAEMVGVISADPDCALARIAADRQILALHRPNGRNILGYPVCDACTPLKPTPCQTVRLLALPYADRPGYREEWRP